MMTAPAPAACAVRMMAPRLCGIFYAIEHDEKVGIGRNVFEFGVLLLGADRHHALMGFHSSQPVERAAIFKADRRAGACGPDR